MNQERLFRDAPMSDSFLEMAFRLNENLLPSNGDLWHLMKGKSFQEILDERERELDIVDEEFRKLQTKMALFYARYAERQYDFNDIKIYVELTERGAYRIVRRTPNIQLYPKSKSDPLSFMGNISTDYMNEGAEEIYYFSDELPKITDEINKIKSMYHNAISIVASGIAYLYCLDHSTIALPPDEKWDQNYRASIEFRRGTWNFWSVVEARKFQNLWNDRFMSQRSWICKTPDKKRKFMALYPEIAAGYREPTVLINQIPEGLQNYYTQVNEQDILDQNIR